MSEFLDIATGGGLGLAGDVLGMVGQRQREKRAVKNQKDLNRQGQALGMQTWHETNVGPQMEKLKEAGLNPALMYGKGGAGGATASSPSGGSAPSPQPMELGAMMDNVSRVAAMKLQKATARKTNADAEKVELDNEVTKMYGQDANLYEAHNRRSEALSSGQVKFEGKDKPTNAYEKGLIADLDAKSFDSALRRAQKEGQLNQNQVSKYKADLAKAKIDPDSNPMIREVMKAMAEAGKPLSEILANVVKMFL